MQTSGLASLQTKFFDLSGYTPVPSYEQRSRLRHIARVPLDMGVMGEVWAAPCWRESAAAALLLGPAGAEDLPSDSRGDVA